jgi:hypothetical protein
LSQPIDLVYNRDTDFYFELAEHEALRHAVNTPRGAVKVVPHPYDYRIFADKQRLNDLSHALSSTESAALLAISQADREVISKALIRSLDVRTQDPEALWSSRKKWFFKPKRSFGGKAVYRGSAITRSAFAHVVANDYVAQEMVPPPLVRFADQAGEALISATGGESRAAPGGATGGEPVEFKYDLRFFVYRDRIQLACARLYRGQMTNAQTPGGGVALIDWQS